MTCYRLFLSAVLMLLLLPLKTYAQDEPPTTPEPLPSPAAYHFDPYDEPVVPFPFIQIIHAMPTIELVDIYVNGKRILDNFSYLSATPYIPMVWGTYRIDVVESEATNNAKPLSSSTLELRKGVNYAMIFTGRTRPDLLLIKHTRLKSSVPDRNEYILVHAAPRIPPIDVRLLDQVDAFRAANLLVNNFEFGQYVGYWRLLPAPYWFEFTSADNTKMFNYELFETDKTGATFLILVVPDFERTVTFVSIDVNGDVFRPFREGADHTDTVPETLTLRGNYPNPFNPSTTITFDLPEAADVHVDVFDVLGRTVMTTTPRRADAGTNTVDINASALASGAYFYRVTAQTATHTLTQTKQMILTQ